MICKQRTCPFWYRVQALFGAGGKSEAEYIFEPVVGHQAVMVLVV